MIFLDWGDYSDDFNYDLVALVYWRRIAEVLTGRLKVLESEGVTGDNIYMYGHSLGARISIEAGLKFGTNKISQIDGKNILSIDEWSWVKKVFLIACDSAGPGFLIYDIFNDPKNAAKNVQCIHTTILIGTAIYKCHQDWLMGELDFNDIL